MRTLEARPETAQPGCTCTQPDGIDYIGIVELRGNRTGWSRRVRHSGQISRPDQRLRALHAPAGGRVSEGDMRKPVGTLDAGVDIVVGAALVGELLAIITDVLGRTFWTHHCCGPTRLPASRSRLLPSSAVRSRSARATRVHPHLGRSAARSPAPGKLCLRRLAGAADRRNLLSRLAGRALGALGRPADPGNARHMAGIAAYHRDGGAWPLCSDPAARAAGARRDHRRGCGGRTDGSHHRRPRVVVAGAIDGRCGLVRACDRAGDGAPWRAHRLCADPRHDPFLLQRRPGEHVRCRRTWSMV